MKLAVAAAVCGSAFSTHAQLSKGNLILLQRGLQIQGMVTKDDVFHLTTYSNANYTSINWLWDSSASQMGAAPGFPWSRWAGDENKMPPLTGEGAYMSQLVTLQLGDEWNLNDPALRTRAVNWFNAIRANFPNTILYMNNFGGQVGDAELGDFTTRARPDMLSFDSYPWKSDYTTRAPIGGPPTSWYGDLRRYREHAKGANIPLASYVQTFHAVQDYDRTVYRDASPSELRLNHFAALAFNAKVLIDFTYNTGASSLFTTPGGDSNPTPLLAEKTDIARRARNLGRALVRLRPIGDAPGGFTTSIMYLRGKNSSGGLNTPPIGFRADPDDSNYTEWVFGRNDPYLRGWAVTNVGTVNNGQRGDVILSWFRSLDEGFDGPDQTNQIYLMVVNGLTDPAGSTAACRQEIRLNFGFPAGITGLVMLDPVTGRLQTNTLPTVSGQRQLMLNLDGGDAALFKFDNGAPFVGWGPPVAISSPANGALFTAPATIPLSAIALDSDNPTARLEFFVGDAKIGESTNAIFSTIWSNAVEGLYTLTAVATGRNGTRATSAPVTISLQPALVSSASTWKYLDNGSDPGAAWRTIAFNDAAWRSGPAPLGYGDSDEATVVSYGPDANNKYITTYFRHAFVVEDAASFTNLLLRLHRDDGAVVYLNGLEVFRSNMPGGTIAHTTLASAAADESIAFYSATLSSNRVVNGTNQFAVEVHQAAANSSDLSFDLELIGRRPVRPPALGIRRAALDAILSWSAFINGYRLETAPSLSEPPIWLEVTNAISTANTEKVVRVRMTEDGFFRLRKP